MSSASSPPRQFQHRRIIGARVPSPELKSWVPPVASRADYGYVDFECTLPFENTQEWRQLKILPRNDPHLRPAA